MYIDLDYFIITEVELSFTPSGYIDINIQAKASVPKDVYDEWIKSDKNNVKLKEIKEITDG